MILESLPLNQEEVTAWPLEAVLELEAVEPRSRGDDRLGFVERRFELGFPTGLQIENREFSDHPLVPTLRGEPSRAGEISFTLAQRR
ncbi:MAG TPA: hypothetical protein VMV08_05405 [Gaiellaceae bacterium]|nr:hypothetical protein [Gaiellaceae bacterium]